MNFIAVSFLKSVSKTDARSPEIDCNKRYIPVAFFVGHQEVAAISIVEGQNVYVWRNTDIDAKREIDFPVGLGIVDRKIGGAVQSAHAFCEGQIVGLLAFGRANPVAGSSEIYERQAFGLGN